MARLAIGSGIRALASLLAVSLGAFLLIALMPADPVMIAIRAWNLAPTEETVAALRENWGLDRSLPERYVIWLTGFVAGDWGLSFRTGEPVLTEFLRRLPLSVGVGVSGLLLAIALSVPLGLAAAQRPGGFADRFSRLIAISVQAVPAFWIGLVAIWLLGVHLQIVRPFSGGPSIVAIATAIIALHSMGVLSRVYRKDMLEQASRPHFRTALAKGLSRHQALWHHCHRSAFFALLAAVRSEAGWVIGSTATLEVLFGLPGISQFLVQSIAVRDYHVLIAYVMVVAGWMLLMNAILQFAMRRLDPRHA
ncbi:ABC transporter permease [Chelativorans sp. ZYF759]|uniref:ABC transporter permease n=1 Tax=Chelativorans sp. ZYF759 TaxID=2692213 RepID=UPI001AEE5380|nr:ABC transporter permease [Chelativorans sp. ZYF759]